MSGAEGRRGGPIAPTPEVCYRRRMTDVAGKDPWVGAEPSASGLTTAEAASRLKSFGTNQPGAERASGPLRELLSQFKSPLVLLLVGAGLVSAIVGELTDALIVLAIVLASTVLGWWQEHRAGKAVAALRARITARSRVVRDGKELVVPSAEVVPGDVVLLSAGALIPADGRVIAAKDLFISEAVLTGETFPVEKRPGSVPGTTPVGQRTNAVFAGTNVRSGTGRVVVTETGVHTLFGGIAGRLSTDAPETDFERGLRQFGVLLSQSMLALTLVVFAVNVVGHKAVVESLLFSVALAVGLAPELLPAILAVNLARGATAMAKHGVIVRRLSAIEDFGAVDVLCTDKTGTITEGVVRLDGAVDAAGEPSPDVQQLAAWNACLQTGLPNPLDEALQAAGPKPGPEVVAVDEVPYDFERKRLTVVVEIGGKRRLITKGAVPTTLPLCTRTGGGLPVVLPALEARVEAWGRQGFRVIAVASRDVEVKDHYSRQDEADLQLDGFLLFFDPPKPGAAEAIQALHKLGVALRIITGDSRHAAAHVAEAVGMKAPRVLTGAELDGLSAEAIGAAIEKVDVFAEVDPTQKERVIVALRKRGHVVGYMGDGINDAPALHAASVGISVDTAVDVAREAADLVLLERDLDVLRAGILEGRTTFANTLKYVRTTESANLGNMLSMAATSVFLPFLPLTATQILLNNFLSDIPAMAIAGDNVDDDELRQPESWDMPALRRFMFGFGGISAAFDGLTFATLLWLFHASADLFRTAWFVESLLTELVVALLVRTRKLAWTSRPGRGLWMSSLGVGLFAVILPYLPGVAFFGLIPLPIGVLAAMLAITLAYALTVELAKRFVRATKPPRRRTWRRR